MATLGDTLLIKLGIDTSGLKASLNQVKGQLRNSSNQMMQDDNQFAANHNKNTKQVGNDLKNTANGFNSALLNAQKFGAGASAASNRAMGSVLGLVKSVSGPLLGLFTTASVMKSYFGGLGQLAEMTGSYFKKLDEWREKMALFNRFTKEDLQLYAKGRRALTDFRIAMADFSAGLMREFNPLMKKGIDLLNDVSRWVSAHQNDIIRFCKVLAGIITTLLIPAFTSLAVAILSNPLTWIIGLVIALALAIDDLIVYLQGGQSLIGHYWDPLIEGAKIAWEWINKLWGKIQNTSAFENLKNTVLTLADTAVACFDNLMTSLQVLWGLLSDLCSWLNSVGFFDSLIDALVYVGDLGYRITNFIISAFSLAFSLISGDTDKISKAFDGFIHSAAEIVRWFVDLFVGAFDEMATIASNIVDAISNAFVALGHTIADALNLDSIINGCKSAVAGLIDYIPDFMKPEGLKKWSDDVRAKTDTSSNQEHKEVQKPAQIIEHLEQNQENKNEKSKEDFVAKSPDFEKTRDSFSLFDAKAQNVAELEQNWKNNIAKRKADFAKQYPDFENKKPQNVEELDQSWKNHIEQKKSTFATQFPDFKKKDGSSTTFDPNAQNVTELDHSWRDYIAQLKEENAKRNKLQVIQDNIKSADQQINILSQGVHAMPSSVATAKAITAPISTQNTTNNNNSAQTVNNNVTINGADAAMTQAAIDSLNNTEGNRVYSGILAQSYA